MPRRALSSRDISLTLHHNGVWELAAIINGYREKRLYAGYTRREAVRKFLAEFGDAA